MLLDLSNETIPRRKIEINVQHLGSGKFGLADGAKLLLTTVGTHGICESARHEAQQGGYASCSWFARQR